MADGLENAGCLDENQVVDLVAGQLEEGPARDATTHLDHCTRCRRTVALLIQDEQGAAASALDSQAVTSPAAEHDGNHRVVAPGERVGRYVVRRLVGAGGMGIVYAAHDPELNRDIALKLIRPELNESDEIIKERLRRESQALAKLSHPNVTAVYDVGTAGNDIFVAIELIDGVTLADWLASGRRSWRSILRVFEQAGQGIAAAHSANLVHRDFKPDNVLISQDGRVVVTDFGLARLVDEVWTDPLEVTDEELDTQEMDLTRTGIAVGTPAYMAPEQHRGRPTDHRTDQFSFCVALFEALYGVRPFAGSTPSQVAKAVERGLIRSRPPRSPVPLRIHRILLRGLKVFPEDRFDSMDELLVALKSPRRRARRRVVTLTAAGALVAGVALGFSMKGSNGTESNACVPGRERIETVWGKDSRAAVLTAFRRSKLKHAVGNHVAVETQIEQWTDEWVLAHDTSCSLANSDAQSADVRDLKLLCLNRRFRELESLVGLLAEGDEAVVDRAVALTSSLTPVSECKNAEQIVRALRPPEDPQIRLKVAALRDSLTEARTLSVAAKYQRARVLLEQTLVEARATGYRPIEAETLVLLGSVIDLVGDHDDAETILREAALAAESSRHDWAAAEAWTELVYVVGYEKAQHKRGLEYASQAEAAIERLGGDDRRLAELRTHVGSIYFDTAEYVEAELAFTEAIDAVRRAYDGEHVNMAMALDGLAHIHRDRGEFERALTLTQQSLELRQKHLGPEHPSLAGPLDAQAGLLFLQGKPEQALPLLEHALMLQRRSLGERHSELAATLVLMGLVKSDLGDDDAAMNLLSRAVSMQEELLGAAHPELARTLVNHGAVLSAAGSHSAAESNYRRALEIAQDLFDDDHLDVATYRFYLGDALREQGRPAEALEMYDRALATMQEVFDEDHPDLAGLHWSIGESHLALGDRSQALAELEAALRIADSAQVDPVSHARIRWSIAKLLSQLGGDRARAVALARQALESLETSMTADEDELAKIRKWLAERARR